MYSTNMIYLILLRKLVKYGKKRSSLSVLNNFRMLSNNEKLLLQAVLKLIVPIELNKKQKTFCSGTSYKLKHYYSSINLALS